MVLAPSCSQMTLLRINYFFCYLFYLGTSPLPFHHWLILFQLFLKCIQHIPTSGPLHILCLFSEMTCTPTCRTCSHTLCGSLVNVVLIIEAPWQVYIKRGHIYIHMHTTTQLSPFLFALFFFLSFSTSWHIMYLVLSFSTTIKIPWRQSIHCCLTRAYLAHSRCPVNICGFSFWVWVGPLQSKILSKWNSCDYVIITWKTQVSQGPQTYNLIYTNQRNLGQYSSMQLALDSKLCSLIPQQVLSPRHFLRFSQEKVHLHYWAAPVRGGTMAPLQPYTMRESLKSKV